LSASPSPFLRGELLLEELQALRNEFDERLLPLARRPGRVPESERLAWHLWDHSQQRFTFVADPPVEATNWQAE
jgi:transposase